jgi:hypothetical protein
MPKAKPTYVISHRIELQDKERDDLSMIAASMAIKNVGEGIGSLGSMITKATPAGAILLGTVISYFAVESFGEKLFGFLDDNEKKATDDIPYSHRETGETAKEYRDRTTWQERIIHSFRPETITNDLNKLLNRE